MPFAELRARVLEANRAIVRADLVVLSFGNASGLDRAAGVMLIKPSGVPYDQMTADDLVAVSVADGRIVEGQHRPSSDTPTHLVLYRRFDGIGGIVHTHSRWATSWAQAGLPIPPYGTTHADHFRGPVPVTRALTPAEIEGAYEEATGDVIVETFDSAGLSPVALPGVLVASHGPFTWGADPAAAVDNAVALELVAQMAVVTNQLRPGAPPVGEALLERHYLRKHGPAAYYGQPR